MLSAPANTRYRSKWVGYRVTSKSAFASCGPGVGCGLAGDGPGSDRREAKRPGRRSSSGASRVLNVPVQSHLVKKRRATSKPFRCAVAVALCYIFVLQAFLASFSIALAIGQASAGTGAVMCHGGGGTPAGPDNRIPASDSCVMCANCALASAGGLPAPTTLTFLARRTASRRVAIFDISVLAKAPPPRAGFARAPPKFA